LEECSAYSENGVASGVGESRCHSYGLFFGYADIYEPASGRFAPVWIETYGSGSAGCQNAQAGVVGHAVKHMTGKYVDIVVGVGRGAERSGLGVERCREMECLFVLFSNRQPVAFSCVYVDYDRGVGIFYFAEGFDQ
jgi:hypothetical protein